MQLEKREDEIRYHTQRPSGDGVFKARYRLGAKLDESDPNSLEFFLAERYLLFVDRGKDLYCGQVHHRPYPLQKVELSTVEEGLFAAAGFPAAKGLPEFAHYASGVDVDIFPLLKLSP